MRCLVAIVCFVSSLMAPVSLLAQNNEADPPVMPLKSYTGFSWGAAHTIWNGRWNNEGYPRAGTLAPYVSLRKVSPAGPKLAVVPYVSYFAMHSTVSTLICDTCTQGALNDDTKTERMYFREIDLGLNLQYHPSVKCPEWYVGGGASVRWGQAGLRVRGEPRPGDIRKATWFGLTLLCGYLHDWGARTAVFIEPQFTFSPDPADRWQRNYPPDLVTLQMGLLW